MRHYYGINSSPEHLAHYGIKGMRWGVRRALANGNEKALDRHYQKAAKKLAKLQDIGINSKKYAAKAAAYGTAAVGTGTIAIGGVGMFGKVASEWGAKPGYYTDYKEVYNIRSRNANPHSYSTNGSSTVKRISSRKPGSLTNNDLVRIGSAAATAGLLAKSAQNAYRAANGRKYRDKAVRWKNEMDNAFSGTKYQGLYAVPPRKKRRKST